MRAPREFLAIARPFDQVAVHALANPVFHVVLPLTHDRDRALNFIGAIPDLSGWTPLYDAPVLSCAQESLYRRKDLSAIVVLSDARDNQLDSGRANASGARLFEATSYEDLAQVYARVAEDLRSVYSVGFYPRNQDFNGAWRRIQVRLRASGRVLRTRTGYYAW